MVIPNNTNDHGNSNNYNRIKQQDTVTNADRDATDVRSYQMGTVRPEGLPATEELM